MTSPKSPPPDPGADPGTASGSAPDLGPAAEYVNRTELETPRLDLSIALDSDAEAIFAMTHGERGLAVTRTLCWDGPANLGEIHEWLRAARERTLGEFGCHWILRDRTGQLAGSVGAPMGSVGLRAEPEPGRANLGYYLGEAYWGHGLMAEAVYEVTRHGFEDLGLAKIEADVFPTNPRGLGLLDKLGFLREGITRRAHRKGGVWRDVVRFGVLPDELREPPPREPRLGL